MSSENAVENRKKILERPEKVVCQECGGQFNLLHRLHLRVHGYNSQAEYREVYGIGAEVPLNSQGYSDLRRQIQQQPENSQQSIEMGRNWGLQRRVALVLLEREGFYTPRRTSEITQIPLQTIYSAIKREALPSTRRKLLVETAHGLVVSGDRIVQGITLKDMLEFAKHHRPKSPFKK